MIFYTDKPDWSKAFTGATHLIQLIDSLNYVFAVHYYGDFFSQVDRITSFNNFDVIESRPIDKNEGEHVFNKAAFGKSYEEALASSTLKPIHDMDVVNLYPEKVPDYKSKIEAQGIRKAVAHLKENHGGDRYSSSAYLNYADNLENNTNEK